MASITVRELIRKLVSHGMDEEVFIGLGPNATPTGGAKLKTTSDVYSGSLSIGRYGVYLIPFEHVEIKD